ncbi:MAG: OmcA/MtrC family decaheme c-type cytochrome [Candidatus Thiodiazotropha sp.]
MSGVLVLTMILAGCGGGSDGGNVVGGGGGGGGGSAATTVSLNDILAGNATLASGDSSAPFTSNLPAGVVAVTVNSPPVVNFSITSADGKPVTGLSTSEVRIALAKLVPGTPGNFGVPGSGNPDQWVSYIYRQVTGTAVPAGAWQATTETPASLVYNENGGYYTYTFSTDITTATIPGTSTLIWDPTATHRIAIQLQIRDANRNTVAVSNPYFDFTFDSNGESVAVDAADTRKVVDRSSCNECHNQLALHGGGRIDPQYCVMCHNPGTTEAETGQVVDFKVMIHKIHKGRALSTPYILGGYMGTLHDFSEVGFPQDLRNCTKCHDGSKRDGNGDLVTPQGDNWKNKPTQQACGACHDTVDFNDHQSFDFVADDGTLDNSACAVCHAGASSIASVETVHFNQLEEDAKNYQFNIENVSYDAGTRQATVTYSLTNPNDGTAYDLTADCSGACTSANIYYNLRLYVASLSLIGAPNSIADFTNTVNDRAVNGADDGSHHYTLTLPALPDTSAEQSHGTARVVSIGQVKEPKVLNVVTGEVDAATLLDVPVLNTYQDFTIDGTLVPRREVVSTDKCNACHGMLGTASGSNTLANAFHRGARNTVDACPICHNANRASTTLMTDPNGDVLPVFPVTSQFDGRTYNQSYQFKNMIHGIHGGSRRSSPYTHGNPPGEVEDYSVEVAYPGILSDCTTCHINDSYRTDGSVLGSSVLSTSTTVFDSTTGAGNPNADLVSFVLNVDSLVDPLQLPVFSPKAASCTGCHDTAANRDHMLTIGGAAFDMNQADVALDGRVFERCDECHGVSGAVDIKSVHHVN